MRKIYNFIIYILLFYLLISKLGNIKFMSICERSKLNKIYYFRGFRKTLGTGKLNSDGYILDTKTYTEFSRFPIIITDAHMVCGRRFVFGANNIFEGLQIILKLIIARENATDSVESPRIFISNNGTTDIEGMQLENKKFSSR